MGKYSLLLSIAACIYSAAGVRDMALGLSTGVIATLVVIFSVVLYLMLYLKPYAKNRKEAAEEGSSGLKFEVKYFIAALVGVVSTAVVTYAIVCGILPIYIGEVTATDWGLGVCILIVSGLVGLFMDRLYVHGIVDGTVWLKVAKIQEALVGAIDTDKVISEAVTKTGLGEDQVKALVDIIKATQSRK